jgi:hypothetical protein
MDSHAAIHQQRVTGEYSGFATLSRLRQIAPIPSPPMPNSSLVPEFESALRL